MTLRKDVKHPFPPESDEVTISKAADDSAKPAASPAAEKPAETPTAEPKPEAAATAKPPATLVIDFDGISNRVARVPLPADNYGNLSAKTGHLLYAVGGAGYYGRQGDRTTSLRIYAVKDRKETTLVEDMRGYTLSDDGSKVLVFQGPGRESLRRNSTGRADLVRPYRLPDCMSIAFRRRNGTRSSMRCGVDIAIGSTSQTCTATIGSRYANSTNLC